MLLLSTYKRWLKMEETKQRTRRNATKVPSDVTILSLFILTPS